MDHILLVLHIPYCNLYGGSLAQECLICNMKLHYVVLLCRSNTTRQQRLVQRSVNIPQSSIPTNQHNNTQWMCTRLPFSIQLVAKVLAGT